MTKAQLHNVKNFADVGRYGCVRKRLCTWQRAGQMGTLNVLDLVFTPFPQCLPKMRIKRFLVGKRLTRPNGEILKTSYITEQN